MPLHHDDERHARNAMSDILLTGLPFRPFDCFEENDRDCLSFGSSASLPLDVDRLAALTIAGARILPTLSRRPEVDYSARSTNKLIAGSYGRQR
jgi:hypothetical protein